MAETQKFVQLGRPRRIWAVASIHGEVNRLAALHDDIGGRFLPGDRLIYLGNMIGRGPSVAETIDELLAFRRAILAMRGVIDTDIVYLRGGQEEMWQKLLQLQFAPNPMQVLQWMLGQGVESTLMAYGGDVQFGLACARDGAVSLTRWTNQLRAAQRAAPGHDAFYTSLRRAAFTGAGEPASGLLFVNAGVDTSRPLGHQGDSFWWGGMGFNRITEPFGEFVRIVRGYDPAHGGPVVTPHAVTLDGGCGFGGKLICGCLAPTGDILELAEV